MIGHVIWGFKLSPMTEIQGWFDGLSPEKKVEFGFKFHWKWDTSVTAAKCVSDIVFEHFGFVCPDSRNCYFGVEIDRINTLDPVRLNVINPVSRRAKDQFVEMYEKLPTDLIQNVLWYMEPEVWIVWE